MNCVNKLVLGTVQFGLDYGINNQFGQVWKIQCKLPPKTKRFCPLVLK